MIRSIGAVALAGFLLLPVTGRSEPAASDPALALMKRSGLHEQLGALAPTVEQQLQTAHPGMPLATRAKLVDALREAYEPQPLREAALALIRRSLDPNHLPAVEAWLGSARGRRVTQLEEQAATPDAARRMQAYAASLQKQPPSAARISQVQQLDLLTGASEFGLEVMTETAGAVARGMSALDGGAVSAAEIHAAIEARRPELKAAVEQSTLAVLLYTYQPLTGEELGAYVSFMASPAGRWYRQVMVDASAAAFRQANARLEARLAGGARGSTRPAAIAR
jgi:hypothetical protein